MTAIRDQRELHGPLGHALGPEEMEKLWHSPDFWSRGWPTRVPGTMTVAPPFEVGITVEAYVSDNRWVADCVCGSGMMCWVENPKAICLGCGRIYKVKFPPAKTRAAAESTLLQRPPEFRNWFPHLGEDAKMLRAENKEHAIPADAPPWAIVSDFLPAEEPG